jgi:YD repeat-containing protein
MLQAGREDGNPVQSNAEGNAPFTSFQQVLNLTRRVDPDPNGKYIITDYVLDTDGNTIETIDGRGISQTVAYDSRDRATEQVQAAGTAVAAKTETVYDANGNVTEVRSPRYFDANDTNGYQKAKTTMTYGGRNRLASRTDAPGTAEAGTESYTYTVDGRLDTRTDARGNDWQTIYHACCGRTQATVDPLGHGTITNNDYRGNVTHQITVSDVASHTNYHDPDDAKTLGEVTTRYDERNRPVARTTWLVPLAVVDPNNVSIAGLAGVPSSDGLTQRWFYDDDLDDGQGLDAGITVAKIDGSGSFTLNISQLLTELSTDGTDLGATSGSASAFLN